MGCGEDNDFYLQLSKKELQELCKKHGLSPYMKKGNLVNSLHSYFKGSGCTAVQCSESLLDKCGGNSDLTCKNVETVNPQNALCNDSDLDPEGNCRKVCSCKNSVTLESEVGKSNGPQTRSRTKGALAKDDTSARFFEFFAGSEEGINLTVDLNSISSDWSQALQSSVCCCHYMHSNKFPSLREELELLANRRKENKDSSPRNTNFEHEMNKHVQGASYSDEGQYEHVVAKTCTVAPVMHPQEKENIEINVNSGTMSCPINIETDSDAQEKENIVIHVNPGTESCPIIIETDSVERNVVSSQQKDLSSDSVFYSATDDAENLDLLEHQNSETSQRFYDEAHNCTPATTNLPCNRSSHSVDIQLPRAVNEQKDVSSSLRRSNRLQQVAGSAVSGECTPALTKERERSQFRTEAKTSGSLQLPEETSMASEGDKVLKRTRQHYEGVNLNYSFPNVKVLRSHKHLLGPRRSPRLAE